MAAQPRRKVFFAYRDAPMRRAALALPHQAPERYTLSGLDEIAAHGAEVRHNLERRVPLRWARAADMIFNRTLYGLGGYGGDFVSVLGSLHAINDADVVLSTVDTVGLPLVLLRRAQLVRTPIVYVAIGLPERLVQLRRLAGVYRDALRDTRAVVTYSASEARWLRDWLGAGARVEFVPFGVDTEAFQPTAAEPEFDVLSIGADPRRDFALLLELATRQPDMSVRIVASRDHARSLGAVPQNVTVEADIPLTIVRERLAAARVVALPVRENSYSGATTTLLQAMAMAKPVVVSRTDAIASGYGLEDGVNCRLVPPADGGSLERVVLELLASADASLELGIRARETVERSLTWERYTNALWELLAD
jgi:glycosyltransferase involved in cell wall biosynthesis